MILAGDIGGTKVNLAVVERNAGVEIVRERRFETSRYGGLEEVVREFLAGSSETIKSACFGVAGPVIGETIELTNAGWTVHRSALREAIGIERVDFLNDLEATAYGLDQLAEDQVAVLAQGEPRGVTAALIAAGTGLGMAVVTKFDGRAFALASEGGHAEFAPRDEEEAALWEFLRRRHGHVSAERVVSGPGIRNVYEFLKETRREDEPEWLAERLAGSEDPSAAISEAAIDGEAPICERAMEIFVGCYGAVAGNLVLTTLALRGLYVGGGIAPSILGFLEADDRFVRAFRAKGRLSDLLADVPVFVVLEPRAAVLGAARYATLPRD